MNECMAWLRAVQFLICCTYIRRPQKLPLLLLRMIIVIIITNSVNIIITGRLYPSNHIHRKIVNVIHREKLKVLLTNLSVMWSGVVWSGMQR